MVLLASRDVAARMGNAANGCMRCGLAGTPAWAAFEGRIASAPSACISGHANAKTPAFWAGVLGLGSLTITYFHTGIRTIIGVE
ncbi:hypothetical protein, partial [Burkholderia anthina]|uniref:hypothetical protein n=1 Tax=Burkholderia anthina TaxID=179879 RepID=UPI001C2E9241